jgi:hypothetical protein
MLSDEERTRREQLYRDGCAEYLRTDLDGRAYAITNCGMCDEDGYAGVTVCDHIDRTNSTASGRALVQAELAKIRQRKAGAA